MKIAFVYDALYPYINGGAEKPFPLEDRVLIPSSKEQPGQMSV